MVHPENRKKELTDIILHHPILAFSCLIILTTVTILVIYFVKKYQASRNQEKATIDNMINPGLAEVNGLGVVDDDI